jgi:hypothetical protein
MCTEMHNLLFNLTFLENIPKILMNTLPHLLDLRIPLSVEAQIYIRILAHITALALLWLHLGD